MKREVSWKELFRVRRQIRKPSWRELDKQPEVSLDKVGNKTDFQNSIKSDISALSYMGLATEVQTQEDQLLVDHSLVDDGVEEEDDENEKEDKEEEDGKDEKLEEEEDNLDFLQNFPNFYTMAADMMNQLNRDIPEVMLSHKNDTFVWMERKLRFLAGAVDKE